MDVSKLLVCTRIKSGQGCICTDMVADGSAELEGQHYVEEGEREEGSENVPHKELRYRPRGT